VSQAAEVEKLRVVPATRLCSGQQQFILFGGWIGEISAGNNPKKKSKNPQNVFGAQS